LSAVIPLKMRAITIRVNDIVGVAGFIIPGDRVDMLLTREDSERGKLETTLLLQNVQILAIDQLASEDQNEPRVARAITIAVTPTQAQKVVLATSVGSLNLALRNRGDADPAQATRITLADLGIGEAFRPAGAAVAGPAPTPRRRGAQVAVARGLAVVKHTVEREKFEPLSPTQLAPSLSSGSAPANDGQKDDGAPAKTNGKAPVAENEPKDEAPAPLLPPDRVNF